MQKIINGVKMAVALPLALYFVWWASETVAGREAMQEIFGD